MEGANKWKSGIRLIILRKRNHKALIYVCRSSELERELKRTQVVQFLSNYGYVDMELESALEHLKERTNGCLEFPHEIGVFLGYPLEDVVGFIHNNEKIFNLQVCGKCMETEKKQKKDLESIKNARTFICACGTREGVSGS